MPLRLRRRGARVDRVDPHRPRDVLQFLVAGIAKRRRHLALHLVVGSARQADAAGRGNAFEARGDVDAVAMDVVAVNDHVAQIDADAEFDAPLGRLRGIALGHRLLHAHGAGHRFDDAGEFEQEAVAGGLDDAAFVLGDLGVDQFAAQRLQAGQRAGFVLAHQPAVARNIGHENGGKPALDPLFAQGALRETPASAAGGHLPKSLL